MTKNELLDEIKKMTATYDDLLDDIHDIKANGSLSKMVNFSAEFDTTFDEFFDADELE